MQALSYLRGSSGLAADCIRVLSNPPTSSEPIFPNLRIVVLHEPSETIVPLLRHLAPPKLTDISLEDVVNLGTAIEAFTECPIVTELRVLQWASVDALSGLICRWKNLRSANCYDVGFNIEVLSHLSTLRNLLSLSFNVYDTMVDRISTSQSPASTLRFATLRDLHLTSNSLTSIWRLLRLLCVPQVHALSIRLHVGPAAPDLMAFFIALQGACTHDSKLSLHIYTHYESSIIRWQGASPFYITLDLLRPLTVFVNIKAITLDIPCGADLNECELLCLASSWPNLDMFVVGKDYDWKESSSITPEGFLQLMERCRSLRIFFFMFNTRGYTEIPQGHPWRGLTMPQGAYINVLHSPIGKESSRGPRRFLSCGFPPDFQPTFSLEL